MTPRPFPMEKDDFIIGVDPGSRHCGIVVVNALGEIPWARTVRADGRTAQDRIRNIWRCLRSRANAPDIQAKAIICEDMEDANDERHRWTQRLIGAVMALQCTAPFPEVFLLDNREWHKQLKGKAYLTKWDIFDHVAQHLPHPCWQNDKIHEDLVSGKVWGGHLVDAGGIALAFLDMVQKNSVVGGRKCYYTNG